MKQTILLLAGTVLLGFGACKKDDKNQTRQEMIIGTWTLSQVGIDINNNSTLESTEATTSPWAGTVVFSSNGTAISTTNILGTPITDTSSWAFENNEQVLRVISDGDTSRVTVTELTSNRMVTLDKETNPAAGNWSVLTK